MIRGRRDRVSRAVPVGVAVAMLFRFSSHAKSRGAHRLAHEVVHVFPANRTQSQILWLRVPCWPILGSMRLKTSIWVAAYLRRCQTEGVFGAVRRRGAEEAGAVFVKVALMDGTAMLYVPAPQTVYDDSRPIDRFFTAVSAQPIPEAAVEERLTREVRFDPDAWIVEAEDKAGRHFLDLA